MKSLFAAAALCLFSINSHATDVTDATDLLPSCIASGEIELLTKRSSNVVYGHINNEQVKFYRYKTLIYGEYHNQNVVLDVDGDVIRGSIGKQQISLKYRGGVARGFILCIY